jgi:hypothetical protein
MDEFRGIKNNSQINQGLPDTILSETPTCAPKSNQRPVSYTRVRENDINRTKNEGTTYFTDSSTVPKFHITSVSCAKTRRDSPSNIQSQSFKRICNCGTFPPHKYASRAQFPSAQRLDVQSRSIPGVLSLECNKITPMLSKNCLQSGIARNDLPPARTEHSTKNILHTDKFCSTTTTRPVECEDFSLPRRFFNSQSRLSHTARPCPSHSADTTKIRMGNQFRKIGTLSSDAHYFLRNFVEYLGQYKSPSKRKSCVHKQQSSSCARTRQNNLKRDTKASRTTELFQLCSPTRPAQPPTVVDVHDHITKPFDEAVRNTIKSYNRTKLVDTELPVIYPVALSTTDTLSGDGCVRLGLGSTGRRPSPLGPLVTTGARSPLQPKRDASDTICYSGTRSPIKSQHGLNTVRQQDISGLPKKRRGGKISSPRRHNLSNSEFIRQTSHSLQHTVSPRQVQQSSRSPVTPPPSPGVASSTSLCGESVCEVGYPNDRLVRISDSPRSEQLCFTRPYRPSSPISRRVQCPLELPVSMGVSPAVSSSKSIDSSESIDGNIPSGSTTMENGILARRSQNQSTCSTNNSEPFTSSPNRHVNGSTTLEGREHHPRGLEMWGWGETLATWNDEQRSLLQNSWRKSTLKTYEVAWKRWTSWSKAKHIDFKNPTGGQLAQFLSDLYIVNKFSYNTILLHKSVVSTLSNTEQSSPLSSHVLVKHILKSIAIKNPKSSKPPIWDVNKLTSFLTNYVIDVNNVFQTSRHTAILLLLSSGRRIHDLTLLTTDPSHCIMSDDSIIFWPQFGSKTDTSNYRQSGWKLLSNTNDHNLDPLFWIRRTIVLLNERRNAAKTSNLFVTIRGEARAASRTVIAGWVKTLFKEAGIEAAPGSTRSAVASKSWLNNHSLEDILARGNWRSVNTFQKFYRREVISDVDSNNITRLFNPI